MSRKVFPGDTQWAIAGQIAAPVLVEIGRRLPDWLHGDGHKVVTGTDGFAALLVFGGAAELGDELAAELARRGKTYLLDFDDEAYSIKELTGARVKRLRGYPNEFLEERGIIAPGWEPSPPSPMIGVAVVEGITAEEARRAYPHVEARFAEHARGVLVFGDGATSIAVNLSLRRKLRSYTVYFNRNDGDFFCTVRHPDGTDGCFALGKPSPITRSSTRSSARPPWTASSACWEFPVSCSPQPRVSRVAALAAPASAAMRQRSRSSDAHRPTRSRLAAAQLGSATGMLTTGRWGRHSCQAASLLPYGTSRASWNGTKPWGHSQSIRHSNR